MVRKNMEKIKTAIIGCGNRASSHAQAALNGEVLELIYVCDSSKERADKSAGEWKVRALYSADEVFSNNNIEAVIIVTDVSSHVELTLKALQAGKHVIVEKPLGNNIESMRKLIAKKNQTGLTAYVSFQVRFTPELLTIKKEAISLQPVQIFFSRHRDMVKPQFQSPSPFHGIMDVCAHDFDLVSWIMNIPPVGVFSVIRRDTFIKNTGTIDIVSIVIDYGDGRSAVICDSLGAPEIGFKYDIIGQHGNIFCTADGRLSGVLHEKENSSAKKIIFPKASAGVNKDAELQKAFYNEIVHSVKSEAATLEDGLYSALLTAGAIRSAQEHRYIELKEL